MRSMHSTSSQTSLRLTQPPTSQQPQVGSFTFVNAHILHLLIEWQEEAVDGSKQPPDWSMSYVIIIVMLSTSVVV